MCGLVGCAGQIMSNDVNAFHDLIWIDSVRGRDGCGIAKVPFAQPDRALITKVSGDAANLFDTKSYWQLVNANSALLLGHNRYKTHGDASFKNAHPFRHGNIVGAHNGVINNKYQLKDGIRFDTDSEAVFYNINELGVNQTVPKLEGSYALVWYDLSEGTLNFIRNKERPLYFVFNDTHDTIFWASEAGMLYHVLGRHDIKFEGKSVKLLPENIHFRFKLPTESRKAIPEPIRQKLEQKSFFSDDLWEKLPGGGWKYKGNNPGRTNRSPPWTNGQHGGSQTGTQNGRDRVFGSEEPNKDSVQSCDANIALRKPVEADLLKPGAETQGVTVKDSTGKDAKTFLENVTEKMKSMKEVISGPSSEPIIRLSRLIKPKKGKASDAYYLGWDASHEVYGREQFEALMQKGCCYCTATPVWGEPVKFLKDKSFLCADCVTQPDIIGAVRDIL